MLVATIGMLVYSVGAVDLGGEEAQLGYLAQS
jgi:hypothetical protein